MKKIICLILAAAVAAAALVCCTAKPNPDKPDTSKKLVVSEVTHSIFYAPQYVALNKGYFADEGLDIELINAGGADKVMTSVLTDAADIGLAGAEAAVYVYLEGKEDYPKVYGQLTKKDGSFLVGRKPDDNFEWASLENSVILPGRKGGMPYMTLLYALNKNNLIEGLDVTFDDSIQFDAMVGAFVAGEGDYVTVFEPSASALEAEGQGYILASVGEEAGEVPYTAYFTKPDFDKEALQKFLNAIAKGQQFVQNSTAEEIAAAIAPSFPDTDPETIATVVQRYKDIDAFSADPVMTADGFDRIIDIMKNAGELESGATVPFADLIDNTYANAAANNTDG